MTILCLYEMCSGWLIDTNISPPTRLRRYSSEQRYVQLGNRILCSLEVSSSKMRGQEEQDIVQMLDSVDSTSFHTDADRYAAKEAARRLLSRLETPFERGWALAFENPVLVAGLQVGLDLGIWERWASEERQSNGTPQKLRNIVSWCNAAVEENVIRKYILLSNKSPAKEGRPILPTHCRALPS
jgi:hypothetical protein